MAEERVSLLQRRQALEVANHVRNQRCLLRLELRTLNYDAGRARLADVLETDPDWIQTAHVEVLLHWPARMGPESAQRLLLRAGVQRVAKPWGELPSSQRMRVIRGAAIMSAMLALVGWALFIVVFIALPWVKR